MLIPLLLALQSLPDTPPPPPPVPQDVARVLADVYGSFLYVCDPDWHAPSAKAQRRAERLARKSELGRDLSAMQAYYQRRFDQGSGDEVFLPTHCPRPEEIPDWEHRDERSRRAIKHLTSTLKFHHVLP